MEKLQDGHQMFVPGGWEGLNSTGSLYHVLARTGPDTYAFTTCNPAAGL